MFVSLHIQWHHLAIVRETQITSYAHALLGRPRPAQKTYHLLKLLIRFRTFYGQNIHQEWWTILTHFYGAMLCITRTVLPQYVRLSHAGIVLKRLNVSSNFFTVGYSCHSSFFRTNRYGDILIGTPLTEASNSGVWNNRDFRSTSRFILEMIQDRAIVTTECEYETVPKLSRGTNDLEWPLTQTSRSRHYMICWISQKQYEIHSYNGIIIVTYIRSTRGCHFEWPWAILSDLESFKEILSDTKHREVSATTKLLLRIWFHLQMRATQLVNRPEMSFLFSFIETKGSRGKFTFCTSIIIVPKHPEFHWNPTTPSCKRIYRDRPTHDR